MTNDNRTNVGIEVNSGDSFSQLPPSESSRRTWLIACGATGGLAAVSTAVTFAVSMTPSEKARSAGGPVEVDLSDIPQGGMKTIEWRGKPSCLRCDNGPEYISCKLEKGAIDNQITLIYIQPGKPTQNAYIERFNRTVRQELFELNFFDSIKHAQDLATKWMWSYNNERPNSAIGRITPQMKLEAA